MKRSPINHRSKKTEQVYKERRKIVARLLEERPLCEACAVLGNGPIRVHQRQSVDIHEMVTRGRGGSIVDEKNLLALCRFCHTKITDDPKMGEWHGLVLPSYATDDLYDEAAERRDLARQRRLVTNPSWWPDTNVAYYENR